MDLSEFLLARVAEDEEEVAALRDPLPGSGLWAYEEAGLLCANAARVLAECEAKRRIVEMAQPDLVGVLTALALPYADHPDYDEAWRP